MPSKKRSPLTKLYVLDTNVLLHDPYSLTKFAEHDIFVPFVLLEELDSKKAGNQDLNRNARQATRLLEEIVSQPGCSIERGYPLQTNPGGPALGRLFLQNKSINYLSEETVRKNDNLYLAVLQHLVETQPDGREIIMVTKDLNLRIKARAMGFTAEDLLHDHAVEDADLIYRGWRVLSDAEFIEWAATMESWKEGRATYLRLPLTNQLVNEFVQFPDGEFYRVIEIREGQCTLTQVEDTTKEKNSVMGVCARNLEQRAALDLLLDPEIDLVALLGPAGTGKTMLAVAAALDQISDKDFDSLLFTRATVPLGEDVGFLPGDEEEKMAPWLGALYDNLDVITEAAGSAIEAQKLRTLIDEVLEIRALTFMRGRTFQRKFVIVDEAQNLTPKQMKTLVTRAGNGSKLVVLGNLAQIDTPYLSETSSGLSYLVEGFKGWEHFGALVLETGERSRLANAANERL